MLSQCQNAGLATVAAPFSAHRSLNNDTALLPFMTSVIMEVKCYACVLLTTSLLQPLRGINDSKEQIALKLSSIEHDEISFLTAYT